MALLIISISLFFQNRQLHAARMEALRQGHLEISRLALADPDLMRIWIGTTPEADKTLEEARARVYVNLIFSFWIAAFEVGSATESAVRRALLGFFALSDVREYWTSSRHAWDDVRGTRRERQFIAIADEEFAKAQRWAAQRSLVPQKSETSS
jgi:hypothetical protein